MGNNSGLSVANNNLKPWPPGQSGNPAGRPKGSKNLRSIVRAILDDTSVYEDLDNWAARNKERTPIQAIVVSLTSKALDGDTKAAELLFKYGYDPKAPDDDDKAEKIVVQFMGPDNKEIDMDTYFDKQP